ncbi:hypothetical protein HELRODRAFT_112159 [Helobdella robusta]|uniref:AMP-dependent synthetase/ligase domain-containing protein n=1 Tax=Helobdella robusta TaxID=6412 RepID=T1EFH4_HELRO|nr:hypothetical protein HELRODRAFT_112159 [Helobdella robusta]ESO03778.1 hypothetical protein HELRODRAFT_112159 [Helobdella robusta]
MLHSNSLIGKSNPAAYHFTKYISSINYANFLHSQPKTASFNDLIPSFIKAQEFPNNVAIRDKFRSHSYGDLLTKSHQLSHFIKKKLNDNRSGAKKVSALLCPNDSRYVVSMWGSWMAGSLVLPMSGKHPENLLNYFLQDSSTNVLITTEEYRHVAQKLKDKNPNVYNIFFMVKVTEDLMDRPALIVYTSGTTGNPKGALHTHRTISTMIHGMIDRWGWSQDDVILHALPLNHVHGVINALLTPLTSGACCVMLPKFDPELVWDMILNRKTSTTSTKHQQQRQQQHQQQHQQRSNPNIFMGVPTMYNMLIDSLQQKVEGERWKLSDRDRNKFLGAVKNFCQENIRLFVSGSAPLPLPIIQKWEELTGHTLLERYGMTELGMVFTNFLNGPREPGYVGRPFPLVDVAIAKNINQSERGYEILSVGNEDGTKVFTDGNEVTGELLVKGGTVFSGYLNKEEATSQAFTSDGWFITGDTVSYSQSKDSYKILGRTSVDVIKHGGFKLSALEIENYLLKHENIREVAVLGVKDEKWGQKVFAVVVLKNRDVPFNVDDVRKWCRLHMASYQVPSDFRVVDDLQRNAMGKINKKILLSLYARD